MDPTLSQSIKRWVFNQFYHNFSRVYSNSTDSLVRTIYSGTMRIAFELREVKCDNKICDNSEDRVEKQPFIDKLHQLVFVDSNDDFYQVLPVDFDDNILDLKLVQVSNELYFDIFPSDVIMLVVSNLPADKVKSFCLVKKSLCQKEMWRTLTAYEFPNYIGLINEKLLKMEYRPNWETIYLSLKKLAEKKLLSQFFEQFEQFQLATFNYNLLADIDTLEILYRIKFEIMYPYAPGVITDLEFIKEILISPSNKIIMSIFLKTGEIPELYTFDYMDYPTRYIFIKPKILYAFVTSKNFKYRPDHMYDLFWVLDILKQDTKLFRDYLKKVQQDYPGAVESILERNPDPTRIYKGKYDELVKTIISLL